MRHLWKTSTSPTRCGHDDQYPLWDIATNVHGAMSQQTVQLIEIGIVALGMSIVVLRLSRQKLISFRYTVGWLVLCGLGLVAGLLIPVLKPIADVLRISEVALVATSAVMVLLLVCIQLSISISGLQRQLQDVTEELALTRRRIEERE